MQKDAYMLQNILVDSSGLFCNKNGFEKENLPLSELPQKSDITSKPHICSYCGRAFARRDYLTKHFRCHTKQRPYTCNNCGRNFTQKASLNVHKNHHCHGSASLKDKLPRMTMEEMLHSALDLSKPLSEQKDIIMGQNCVEKIKTENGVKNGAQDDIRKPSLKQEFPDPKKDILKSLDIKKEKDFDKKSSFPIMANPALGLMPPQMPDNKGVNPGFNPFMMNPQMLQLMMLYGAMPHYGMGMPMFMPNGDMLKSQGMNPQLMNLLIQNSLLQSMGAPNLGRQPDLQQMQAPSKPKHSNERHTEPLIKQEDGTRARMRADTNTKVVTNLSDLSTTLVKEDEIKQEKPIVLPNIPNSQLNFPKIPTSLVQPNHVMKESQSNGFPEKAEATPDMPPPATSPSYSTSSENNTVFPRRDSMSFPRDLEHARTVAQDGSLQNCMITRSPSTYMGKYRRRYDKIHVCHFCFRIFARRDYLTKHLRIHTKERPYICSLCGDRFSQKGTLNSHMKCHRAGKSFTCKHCNVQFASKRSLSKHTHAHIEGSYEESPMDERFAVNAEMHQMRYPSANLVPSNLSTINRTVLEKLRESGYLFSSIDLAPRRRRGRKPKAYFMQNDLEYLARGGSMANLTYMQSTGNGQELIEGAKEELTTAEFCMENGIRTEQLEELIKTGRPLFPPSEDMDVFVRDGGSPNTPSEEDFDETDEVDGQLSSSLGASSFLSSEDTPMDLTHAGNDVTGVKKTENGNVPETEYVPLKVVRHGSSKRKSTAVRYIAREENLPKHRRISHEDSFADDSAISSIDEHDSFSESDDDNDELNESYNSVMKLNLNRSLNKAWSVERPRPASNPPKLLPNDSLDLSKPVQYGKQGENGSVDSALEIENEKVENKPHTSSLSDVKSAWSACVSDLESASNSPKDLASNNYDANDACVEGAECINDEVFPEMN